jgi:hypothetical protein
MDIELDGKVAADKAALHKDLSDQERSGLSQQWRLRLKAQPTAALHLQICHQVIWFNVESGNYVFRWSRGGKHQEDGTPSSVATIPTNDWIYQTVTSVTPQHRVLKQAQTVTTITLQQVVLYQAQPVPTKSPQIQ